MKTLESIEATTTRKANGWHAVLAFPNGGRQVFSAPHGTMDAAMQEARHAKRAGDLYPQCRIRDPRPHELIELATYRE
jgi:hypothetical protein